LLANHLSYLDIPILSTLGKARFVTSYEVRDEPVTGQIAKLGNAIFVERRNYSTLLGDIQTIAETLRGGETVVVFPEATTSSGRMLPWKSSLMQAAMLVPRVQVVPIAIQYLEINGVPVQEWNHDLIYYYGRKMQFLPHFKRLLDLKKIKVRVTLLPPVQGRSRKELTQKARRSVSLICR
jgi:1-acyl-sn-glycerol-3-phosphate acyltransferase